MYQKEEWLADIIFDIRSPLLIEPYITHRMCRIKSLLFFGCCFSTAAFIIDQTATIVHPKYFVAGSKYLDYIFRSIPIMLPAKFN